MNSENSKTSKPQVLKKHGEDIDKPSVQIYINKIENTVTFKI